MVGNTQQTPTYATRKTELSAFEEGTLGRTASSGMVPPTERVTEPEWQERSLRLDPAVSAIPAAARSHGQSRTYLVLKRSLDVVVASLALILLLPVFLIVALAIYIENPGSIFYYQTRVGKDNRHFRFYKFRSMVKNAAALQAQLAAANEATGPIFKMRLDPRVTRVGRILRKYSIDELPQFFNVLRGDMSLVGPRPHLPSEVAHYTEAQKQRLMVQPGLVCLREISGRSELTFERWIETDLEYIARRSMRTDLGILLRLVPAVLCGRGAY